MVLQVAITASGRMSLPADIRKRLGLAQGGMVYVEETEGGVMLRTAPQIVAQAQALAKQYAEGRRTPVSDVAAGLSEAEG